MQINKDIMRLVTVNKKGDVYTFNATDKKWIKRTWPRGNSDRRIKACVNKGYELCYPAGKTSTKAGVAVPVN